MFLINFSPFEINGLLSTDSSIGSSFDGLETLTLLLKRFFLNLICKNLK